MFSTRGMLKSPIVTPPPLRFPQKLWKIANECETGAVTWSPDGRSILVRYSLFREEFMSTKNDFFKTDNISSFVRQLNLYGFRKGHEYSLKPAYKSNPDLHEFSNAFFQRDRPELLDKVARKSGVLRERNDICAESKKTKTDIADDSSCDKTWEGFATVVENTDHTYLCTQKPTPSADEAEQKETDTVDQPLTDTEEVPKPSLEEAPEDKPSSSTLDSKPSVPGDIAVPPVSVKKKRGRKPGSKTNPFKLRARKFKTSRKSFFSPSMKNPQQWPSLIYFDDEDDNVFLRNTSRDVMLSSTMSFQETVESLALKEVVQRLRSLKTSGTGYGALLIS